MSKIFCPNCDSEEDYKIIEKDEALNVRGEKIAIKSRVPVCMKCGSEIFIEEIEDKNLELAYAQYRKNHSLLSPSEIKGIREKYSLSQRLLGRLLDWGEVTINRYENGAIQDPAHNEVLTLISKPENMLALFEQNAGLLPTDERDTVKNKIESNIKKEKKDLLEQCFYSFDDTINEFSGYKKLDLQKMKDMISHIVKETGAVYKTKLNKLLWYSDFLYFKNFSVSITGSRYVHLPYGPIPDNYDFIIDAMVKENILIKNEVFINDEISGEELKIANKSNIIMNLTGYEIKIINFIINHLKNKSSKEISDLSHQEEPYKKTNSNDKISYTLASELSLNFK